MMELPCIIRWNTGDASENKSGSVNHVVAADDIHHARLTDAIRPRLDVCEDTTNVRIIGLLVEAQARGHMLDTTYR